MYYTAFLTFSDLFMVSIANDCKFSFGFCYPAPTTRATDIKQNLEHRYV